MLLANARHFLAITNMNILLSLLAGSIMGAAFVLLKLPIPAPPTFEGIAGIIGIWIGYVLVGLL